MSLCIVTCPPAAAIGDIDNVTCPEKFDLVVRAGFQRRQTADAGRFVTATNAITAEASWDTLLAAVDSTKIQLTPLFAETALAPSTPITYGTDGGNDTVYGTPIIVGETNPALTFNFHNLPATIKEQLKAYGCESDDTVYLFTRSGAILAYEYETGKAEGFGVVNDSVFVGTKGFGGASDPNRTPMQLTLSSGWDEKLKVFKPDFNILTKLNP